MPKQKRPRISIDVPPELYDRLDKVMEWGVRNGVLVVILEQFVTLVENYGLTAAWAIREGKLPLFAGMANVKGDYPNGQS